MIEVIVYYTIAAVLISHMHAYMLFGASLIEKKKLNYMNTCADSDVAHSSLYAISRGVYSRCRFGRTLSRCGAGTSEDCCWATRTCSAMVCVFLLCISVMCSTRELVP